MMRGIRGAITVNKNSRQEIERETASLFMEIIRRNKVEIDKVGAIITSSTNDLTAGFPVSGIRKLGFNNLPLFGTQEIKCKRSIKKCIRLLLLIETQKTASEIKHIYLKGAIKLRPDINISAINCF